jgi:hypothetical protein
MKSKFLLTILLVNPLFLAGSIASGSSVKAEDNVPKFSQIVSKLVGLDSKYHSLVTSAIDRAVANQKNIVAEKKTKIKPTLPAMPVTAGMIPAIREQPPADPNPIKK